MKVLNVKDVPEKVMEDFKAACKREGYCLRGGIIKLMKEFISREAGK